MKVYTVHLPEDAQPGDSAALDQLVLVRDGFHWSAALVPLLWLLINRIWGGFLAILALTVVIAALTTARTVGPGPVVALQLCLAVFVGVCAADLKVSSLRRRGLPAVDVVAGHNLEDAERRFLDRWFSAGVETPRPASRAVKLVASGTPQVLGLFPEAGASR